MNNPYKYASMGILLFLILVVIHLVVMISVAFGEATSSELIPARLSSMAVFMSFVVLLLGIIGRSLCLFSGIFLPGRVCIEVSLLCEYSRATNYIIKFPPVINLIVSSMSFIFLYGYLLFLSNDLRSQKVKTALISSFGCMLVAAAAYAVMLSEFSKNFAMTTVASVVFMSFIVYGTMLYVRSLVFLRRAIAKWEPVLDSDELFGEFDDAEQGQISRG